MPVTVADTKILHPQARLGDEAAGNGGRAAHPWQIVQSGAPGVVFQELFEGDLINGKSQLVKWLFANLNADNIALQFPEVCIFALPDTSVGAKNITYLYVGTQDGTAADDIESTSEKYGAGIVVAHPAPHQFTVQWFHEDLVYGGTNQVIENGKIIRLDQRGTYGGAGLYEKLIVNSVPTVHDTTQTTFTTSADAVNTYEAGDLVQTLVDLDTVQVKAEIDEVVDTGLTTTTFDDSGIVVYNKYCPRCVVTFETETATTYKATIDVLGWESSGVLVSGQLISADFEPVNTDPEYNGIMFKVPANAFGGVPFVGDTCTVAFNQSALPVWQRLITLPGASSETKTITIGAGGQSTNEPPA